MDATVDLPTPEALLECAVEAATDAGEYALENYSRRGEVHSDFDHDVKLKLDLECQQRIEEIISSHYPEHAILDDPSCYEIVEAPVDWVAVVSSEITPLATPTAST